MKVYAVRVTYNWLGLLKECLATFQDMIVSRDKVIIVNNASTAGTQEYLEGYRQLGNFHVFNLSENIGGQSYPVNDTRNNSLADEYCKLAEQEQNVIFGGSLA